MDQWVQWIVNTVIAIVGIFVGRVWEKYDHRQKKDREFLEEILRIIPIGSNAYIFLKRHDFGDAFRQEPLKPVSELVHLLEQPSNFFLNRKLEKMKHELFQAIREFREFIITHTFPHEVTEDFYELPKPDSVLSRRVAVLGSHSELSNEELFQLDNEIRKEYEQKRNKLNSLSDTICEKYDALVATARRLL